MSFCPLRGLTGDEVLPSPPGKLLGQLSGYGESMGASPDFKTCGLHKGPLDLEVKPHPGVFLGAAGLATHRGGPVRLDARCQGAQSPDFPPQCGNGAIYLLFCRLTPETEAQRALRQRAAA